MPKHCKIQTIIATEYDGAKIITNDEVFEIFDDQKCPSLMLAIIAACNDYIRTAEGGKVFLSNLRFFDFADFLTNVPSAICKKHGFCALTMNDEIIIDDILSTELIDGTMQLVDEPEFIVTSNELYAVSKAGYEIDALNDKIHFGENLSHPSDDTIDSFYDLDGAKLCVARDDKHYAVEFYENDINKPYIWQLVIKTTEG